MSGKAGERQAGERRGGGRFFSIHAQGMVRVAAATPRASVGDVAANLTAILELAREAAREGADLIVYPELSLSSYAIDDLHLQDALLDAVEDAITRLLAETRELAPVLLVGAPLRRNGRLYNSALVIARGKLLGVVPKSYLPNYREYYEKRWFAPGRGLAGLEIEVAGVAAPFGPDLLFAASDLPDFVFHVEICEDYWAPIPPSSAGALAGALILCNLSASNIIIGKARERELLGASQSARAVAAYVYSASGPGESTTDLAWDGQAMIHELGEPLAASTRLRRRSRADLRRHRYGASAAGAHARRHVQRLRHRGRQSRGPLPPRAVRAPP